MTLNIPFRKLTSEAILPSRGTEEAIGLDLHASEFVLLEPGSRVAVKTGLSVSIPSGFYGRIAPRSGLALKQGVDVLAGVIDPDYRGEILCLLINHGTLPIEIQNGDRIAQLIIEQAALAHAVWFEELSLTQRNASGFGSTGR